MKTVMRHLTLVLALAALSGCESRRDMELRTFRLERMSFETAEPLLTPYIREGGTLSGRGNLITIREEPERLEQIAEILARYDGAPGQIRVHIYVLEAGEFEGSSGLPFETTLRELLPYPGYRLLDEASFGTTEWSSFSREGGAPFAIAGEVKDVRTGSAGRSATIDVTVEGRVESRLGERIQSTVNAPFDETVVVASHKRGGGGPALIVALRAELVAAAAGGRQPVSDSLR